MTLAMTRGQTSGIGLQWFPLPPRLSPERIVGWRIRARREGGLVRVAYTPIRAQR